MISELYLCFRSNTIGETFPVAVKEPIDFLSRIIINSAKTSAIFIKKGGTWLKR